MIVFPLWNTRYVLFRKRNDVKRHILVSNISKENTQSFSYRLFLSNSISKFNDRVTTCAGDCQQKMNYYLRWNKRMWYRLETYCWRNVCSLITTDSVDCNKYHRWLYAEGTSRQALLRSWKSLFHWWYWHLLSYKAILPLRILMST